MPDIIVHVCTNLLLGDGLLGSLVQLFDSLRVEAKILLATDENDWEAGAEMKNLGDPLYTCQYDIATLSRHRV